MTRILSLLPAATEIVCALGAEDELVGISHECDFPPGITHLPRVTSSPIAREASAPDIDAAVRALLASEKPVFVVDADEIMRLTPDVIVTQSLCEVCAVTDGVAHNLTTLMAPAQVVVLPMVGMSLTGVWNDIMAIAAVIGRTSDANHLLASLNARIMRVHEVLKAAKAPRPRVAVIEWLEPLFAAGHWTPELVKRGGGIDVLSEPGAHSAEITMEKLRSQSPELLVFAPCGFDVHRAAQDAQAALARPEWQWARGIPAWAIDGNALTSRPGPRLADAIETLASIIAPALFESAPSAYARIIH